MSWLPVALAGLEGIDAKHSGREEASLVTLKLKVDRTLLLIVGLQMLVCVLKGQPLATEKHGVVC